MIDYSFNCVKQTDNSNQCNIYYKLFSIPLYRRQIDNVQAAEVVEYYGITNNKSTYKIKLKTATGYYNLNLISSRGYEDKIIAAKKIDQLLKLHKAGKIEIGILTPWFIIAVSVISIIVFSIFIFRQKLLVIKAKEGQLIIFHIGLNTNESWMLPISEVKCLELHNSGKNSYDLIILTYEGKRKVINSFITIGPMPEKYIIKVCLNLGLKYKLT